MENGQMLVFSATVGLFLHLVSKVIEVNILDKNSFIAIFGHIFMGFSHVLYICSGVAMYFLLKGL